MKETETSNEEVKTENDAQTSITLESLENDETLMWMAHSIYMEDYYIPDDEDDDKAWDLVWDAIHSFTNPSGEKKVEYAKIYKESEAEKLRRYKEREASCFRQPTEEEKKLIEQEYFEIAKSGEKGIQDDDYDDDEELSADNKAWIIYLEEFVADFKKNNGHLTKKHREIVLEGERSFDNLSEEKRAEYTKRYKEREAEKKRKYEEFYESISLPPRPF